MAYTFNMGQQALPKSRKTFINLHVTISECLECLDHRRMLKAPQETSVTISQ